MRFLVARKYGMGLDDTYAESVGGQHPTSNAVLSCIAEELALWPDGTVIQWWTVDARDASEARLKSTAYAFTGPHLVTYAALAANTSED